jgi:hypothetical protein
MDNAKIYILFRYIAIVGNIVYVLGILRNGINEGFRGTIVEIVSYIGLVFLLVLNTIIIYRLQRIT